MTTPSPCSLALWGQQSFLCALLHVTCIIGRSDKRASLGGMSSKCEMEWVRGERGNHVRAELVRAGKKRVGRFERKRQRQSSRFARFIFDGIRRRRVECAKGAICKKAVGPSVGLFPLLEADRHACRDESTRERASEGRGDPVSMQFHASAVCICSTAYRRNDSLFAIIDVTRVNGS